MNNLQNILNQVATRVKTVSGFSASNVKTERFTGDPINALPSVNIYHQETDVEVLNMGPTRRFQHTAEIVVEIHADKGAQSGPQANLNVIGNQISDAIRSSRTLSSTAYNMLMVGYQDEFSAESGKPTGVRLINFQISWQETLTN